MAQGDMRVRNHPVLGPLPEAPIVRFEFNGESIEGREGDMIAFALMANGIRRLRDSERTGSPRGIYCGIGHCYECRVTVDGVSGVRACLTPIREGMQVVSGEQLPSGRHHE